MEMHNTFNVTGDLILELRDRYGKLKELRHEKNMVVTAGKYYIASRMVGTSYGAMSHMGIGTSATAADPAQTDLLAVLGSRVGLTGGGGTANNNVVTYVATFSSGSGAVTEAGIFNAASGPTMLCRTVFSVINKGTSDTLTINWNVTIS